MLVSFAEYWPHPFFLLHESVGNQDSGSNRGDLFGQFVNPFHQFVPDASPH